MSNGDQSVSGLPEEPLMRLGDDAGATVTSAVVSELASMPVVG
jgi:hypothetical protein